MPALALPAAAAAAAAAEGEDTFETDAAAAPPSILDLLALRTARPDEGFKAKKTPAAPPRAPAKSKTRPPSRGGNCKPKPHNAKRDVQERCAPTELAAALLLADDDEPAGWER